MVIYRALPFKGLQNCSDNVKISMVKGEPDGEQTHVSMRMW